MRLNVWACDRKKSLTIDVGPLMEYKPGNVVGGIRWIWRVVEGMEALGTWLDNRASCAP